MAPKVKGTLRASGAEVDADRASELIEQVLWRLTLLPARMTPRTLTRELLLLERGRYFAGVQVDAEDTVQAALRLLVPQADR